MASEEQASEKLRNYLRELTPEARAMLMAELERGALRGDGLPQAQLLLEHLRALLAEDDPAPTRAGNPIRLFFMPIEPFIVDDEPEHAHDGRLSRACVGPIWEWLAGDLVPAECKAYSADVGRFILNKEAGRAEQAARALQDLVVLRIEEALANAGRDDKVRRQIAYRLGTPRAQADVLAFLTLLKSRDTLAALAARLPPRIRNLSGDQLDSIVAILESVLSRQKDLFPYALTLVMSRLPASWQLVRIAVRAAQSDVAERVADTPYAAAVRIVLAEIERVVRDLDSNFKRGDMERAIAQLKDVHGAIRGMRSEIALGNGSLWARQLAGIRAGVAGLFKSELESIPGRVRRVIRITGPGRQVTRGSIDPDEVDEIEGMLVFLAACKIYASELALNEITLRVLSDLQNYLENGSRSLLDVLRNAEGPERSYRLAQMEATIRFCAKLFGDEYATQLSRAADVAATAERKAAAKG
ncbi:MAG: hypothetical protein R3D62_01820 [Xanthobacteraceae bacterium]